MVAGRDEGVFAIRNHIKLCYKRALQDDPDAGGLVRISVRLEKDGSVADASIACTTMRPVTLPECVRHAFAHARFPAPPPDDDHFVVPFTLRVAK